MWNRKNIKLAGSKIFLKKYLLALVLSFVYLLLMGILSETLPVETFLRNLTDEAVKLHPLHVLRELAFFFGKVIVFPIEGLFLSLGPIVRGEEALTFTSIALGIRGALLHMVLPAHLVHLAVEFLVGLPYEVGLNRAYLKIREDATVDFKDVTYGFKSLKAYRNVAYAQVMREVLTFVFKLFLFFPGVRHHYELFCVPYILAENPNLSWRHVHHMSEKMTHGYKWKLFLLEYSFLGYMVLDALSFHLLGIFYLKPRMQATFAEAYMTIREDAIRRGIVSEGELVGVTEYKRACPV